MRPVIHFVNDHRGGLGRYVEYLIEAQARSHERSHEPGRLTLFGPPALRLPDGIRRVGYRDDYRHWGANQWRFALKSRFFKADRGSLRHFHSMTTGPIDVLTIHGLYTRNWASKNPDPRLASRFSRAQFRSLSALEKRCIAHARAVVFQSQDNREFVEKTMGIKPAPGWHLVLQGVDSRKFAPIPQSEKEAFRRKHFTELPASARWLLFVGHDFKGKGLLRILKELGEQPAPSVDYRLLVFGKDDVHRAEARELSASLEGRVTFFDEDRLLVPAYAASDCLLLDSGSEGAPMVLLEAMASGCVPVITPCGGAREAIAHQSSGILAASAQQIVKMSLELPQDRIHAMSESAVKAARLRSWDSVAEAYERIYETLA